MGVAATREVDHSAAVVSHHEDGYTGPLTRTPLRGSHHTLLLAESLFICQT